MLILVIGTVVGCFGFSKVYFAKSRDASASLKLAFNLMLFVISLFCLIVSLKFFWDLGQFVSETNLSPTTGVFWASMDLLRQSLLFILCFISGLRVVKLLKNKK
jgi:hypothetical protein